MKAIRLRMFAVLAAASILFPSFTSQADEGMWTFENPPRKALKDLYGFEITDAWLEHVRLASVRFMDGGSGSFVSPNGLVMTNHHVAVGQLQKMSTQERDYVKTGFYASAPDQEVSCADLEINVLVSMENVTARVAESARPGMDPEARLKARDAAIGLIENETKDKTGLKPEVVALYQGGEYWLYQYKKYTDVRLVMAPERQAAYYGGDSDNFTFPRHDLDMAFFRVYENGQAVRPERFLKWNTAGAADGDLVFVSGHPGSTDRLNTVAQLEYERDLRYPRTLEWMDRRIGILHEYMKLGPEQHRRGLVQLFGIENGKKALTGEYQGLLDASLFERKQREEADFRARIASRPEWKKAYGKAWDELAKAVDRERGRGSEGFFRKLVYTRLMSIANQIVYHAAEIPKPDAERLDGYHDSQLDELKFYLFSPAPVYKDLAEATVAGGLKYALEHLPASDPYLSAVLGGRTPDEAAAFLIRNTRLEQVPIRKALLEGGKAALDTCTDPLIVLARKLEPMNRKDHEWRRANIESLTKAGSEKIAKALFAVYGREKSPDATFTLRLSYGTVKGYPMNGTQAPTKTTLYGLFDRALSFNRQGDYELPARFWERQGTLDLSTPVNFVSTCDIIGGNSGSPVVNRDGELIGLIFDGNIESLPGRFVYDDTRNRSVSVHAGFIIEALRKLYDAAALADEIQGR